MDPFSFVGALANSLFEIILKEETKALIKKVKKLLFPKDTYITELKVVIQNTVDQYQKKYPIEHQRIQYPFYHSQILFTDLTKHMLYSENKLDKAILKKFKEDSNVINPTEEQIQYFYNLFLEKVSSNDKLKTHFIEETFKKRIFKNSSLLNEIKHTVNDTNTIVTEIHSVIVKKQPNTTQKELTNQIPRLPLNKTEGRTKDLAALRKRLDDTQQVVLLNGMGWYWQNHFSHGLCSRILHKIQAYSLGYPF